MNQKLVLSFVIVTFLIIASASIFYMKTEGNESVLLASNTGNCKFCIETWSQGANSGYGGCVPTQSFVCPDKLTCVEDTCDCPEDSWASDLAKFYASAEGQIGGVTVEAGVGSYSTFVEGTGETTRRPFLGVGCKF